MLLEQHNDGDDGGDEDDDDGGGGYGDAPGSIPSSHTSNHDDDSHSDNDYEKVFPGCQYFQADCELDPKRADRGLKRNN